MAFLDDGDIKVMKDDLAETWPDSIVVHRGSFSSDGQGGSTVTFAANGTYLGRVAYMTGEERESAGREAAEAAFMVTLPGTASVLDTDRIVYGGGTLEVFHVSTPTTWQMATRVEAVELK